MPNLLFITTSSLATNPRLVKEFEFLKEHYKCMVISFEHDDWSLEPSKKIIQRNPQIEFLTINRHKNLYQTIVAKCKHKLAIQLNKFFRLNLKISAFASNDKTPQLISQLKKVHNKQDIHSVIAHNLGAFYPALKCSKSINAKLQLDIEDYHPGEEFYFNKKHELQNRLLIMQKSFDFANAITYASEGIKLKCESVFKIRPETKTKVIINAFKSQDFLMPKSGDKNLNYVWFSQNISPKRGLEDVFEVAKNLPNSNFHFIGKANENFIEAMQPSENIKIHKPMTQDKLHEFLSTMDIGLALENKDGDGNRDICLTNKFLAYAQAGLYIIATDTYGQKQFINQIGDEFGEIIHLSLKDAIQHLDQEVFSEKNKIERWEKAKAFSWEKQSKLLLEVVK